MDHDAIVEGVLQHAARRTGRSVFVSSTKGGGVVSFDANEIQAMGGVFTCSIHCPSLVSLAEALEKFEQYRSPLYTPYSLISTPLYYENERVKAGMFLYFRDETQSLLGVNVETTAEDATSSSSAHVVNVNFI
jgi:hypothetical protein